MVINTNLSAINAWRALETNNTNTQKALQKLSSGYRINSAADDAAGLAISEKMKAQIAGLNMAQRNAQDGISLIQTAEGALNETHSILQRMRELAIQAANDSNTLDDRKAIQKEVDQLKAEIDRISETTEYNTQKLLNGSLGAVGTSSDSAKVEVDSVTGLKIGDYLVTINTAATKASAAAGNNDLSSPTDVSAWDVTINGTKIDFTGMTSATIDDVVNKINSYKDITGVEASNSSNYVKLDQMNYGSDAKIVVGGTDAAKVAGAVTAGVDAVVTIKDPENISQQITGLGQAIDYRGAEFIAKGAANYSATISVTSSGASLQIGANKDQSMLVDINEISTKTLGNATYGYIKDINLQTQDGANKAINVLDEAIKQVSQERSKLGAYQNRLEHTINNLGTSAENLTAAESRIRDVDMAKEMMEFTKDNILNQAATAMLEEIAA
ncbi:hypothetical protein BFT35_12950 [Thermoanaerobacterium thermosaccharolyticum]|uniref:flagellin N-terminal helical domain-containing protein n=1 Tax=Thermoanaerobacterium thermosaccharolyticum TaxID=1517 RepID=UPI000C07B090|nr:hypothetical protein BFT35_12950 [Thermoanaerobacterium thermosaccharolyticum]